MHDVVVERRMLGSARRSRQRLTDQDLVEHLVVALIHVGVALVDGQRARQVEKSMPSRDS